MAAPTLAKPIFVTGPQDDLATADVYAQKGGTVNSIQDKLSEMGISVPDVLKGGKALASLLPIYSQFKNGGFSIKNPSALITRLLSSSSAITSAFKLLGPDVQGTILGGLKEYGPVALTVGNLAAKVQVTNFSNLYQVGNLISSFTNGASGLGIIDKDSIANVIGGVVKHASGVGIPNVYSAITTGLNDVGILSKAAGIALPSIIGGSDLASLKSIAQTLPSGNLSLLNPTVINAFTAGFQRVSTLGIPGLDSPTPADDHKIFNEVMATYGMVDSAWNECKRGDVPFADISKLSGGNLAFTSMVRNGIMRLDPDDPQKDYALASIYGPQTVLGDIKNSFPDTVTNTGTAPTRTPDPTTNTLWDSVKSYLPLGTDYARMPTQERMTEIRNNALKAGTLKPSTLADYEYLGLPYPTQAYGLKPNERATMQPDTTFNDAGPKNFNDAGPKTFNDAGPKNFNDAGPTDWPTNMKGGFNDNPTKNDTNAWW